MNEIVRNKNNVTVDYLKAIACITVVLQHCLSYIINKQSARFAVLLFIYKYSCKLDVPLFFIISGYLLHQQPVRDYFRKKIPRLMMPFFAFTALKMVFSVFISDEFAHGKSLSEQLYEAFAVGNLYWFSYSILIMFLIAPLIWKTVTVTRGTKKYELPIAAIICFVLLVVFNTLNREFLLITFPRIFQLGKTIKQIPFFLLGYIWSKLYPNICQLKKGTAAVLLILSVPMIYFAMNLKPMVYFRSILISILLCMDAFILVWPVKKIPRALRTVSKYTYQVFFLDSFVKIIIFFLIEKLLGSGIYQSPALCLLIMLVEVLTDVSISCIISKTAEKIPVVNVLFGLSNPLQRSDRNKKTASTPK